MTGLVLLAVFILSIAWAATPPPMPDYYEWEAEYVKRP